MAYPAPTKGFSQESQDTATLFAPFGCTHPPPPVPPFLLMKNLSPRTLPDIISWSWKSHNAYMCPWLIKGLSGL